MVLNCYGSLVASTLLRVATQCLVLCRYVQQYVCRYNNVGVCVWRISVALDWSPKLHLRKPQVCLCALVCACVNVFVCRLCESVCLYV